MGRTPCCSYVGMNKGPWTPQEDRLLKNYIEAHGEGHWRTLPTKAGLLRCGKGCRLRWMNYLRPNVKRGHISPDEEEMIIRLHKLLGNRWSLIAGRIPGRTDNEIKNYWNTHLSKKVAETNVHKAFNPKPYQHKEDNSENDLYFEHRKSQGEIAHRQLNDHNTVKESGYSHFPAMNGDQDAVMQDTGSAFSDIQHIVSILMGSEDLIHNPTEMKGHVPLATPQLNALQGSTPDVNFGQKIEISPANIDDLSNIINDHVISRTLPEDYSSPSSHFHLSCEHMDSKSQGSYVSPRLKSISGIDESVLGRNNPLILWNMNDAANVSNLTVAQSQQDEILGYEIDDNSYFMNFDNLGDSFARELGENITSSGAQYPTFTDQCSEPLLSSLSWFDCIDWVQHLSQTGDNNSYSN